MPKIAWIQQLNSPASFNTDINTIKIKVDPSLGFHGHISPKQLIQGGVTHYNNVNALNKEDKVDCKITKSVSLWQKFRNLNGPRRNQLLMQHRLKRPPLLQVNTNLLLEKCPKSIQSGGCPSIICSNSIEMFYIMGYQNTCQRGHAMIEREQNAMTMIVLNLPFQLTPDWHLLLTSVFLEMTFT